MTAGAAPTAIVPTTTAAAVPAAFVKALRVHVPGCCGKATLSNGTVGNTGLVIPRVCISWLGVICGNS